MLAQTCPSVGKSRANGRLTSKKNQVDEIAKVNPAVAIGNYPFFDPQHRRQRECGTARQKLAPSKRTAEDMLERVAASTIK